MEFIALPVEAGDSFILKDNNQIYIVDGGISETAITAMVKGEIGEKRIDILICTHYDADHINGVIGLIKSDIDIKEIWLPSIFAKVVKNTGDFNELFGEEEFEDEEEIEEEIEVEARMIAITKSMRKQYKKVIFYILPKIYKLLNSLLIRKDKTIIRWFKYNHWPTETKIKNYPLIGLNCEEVKRIRPYKSHDALVLELTLINRMGLVFKYDKEGRPNVLFTSDSNFAFLHHGVIELKEHSIVTAPHHGSKDNQNVYKKIKGENLIYVRSDRINSKRPCQNYIMQKNKYCTICNNTSKHIKVHLKYQSGLWQPTNGKCTCELKL
jgi:Metallo-beta-lactamase superfamily